MKDSKLFPDAARAIAVDPLEGLDLVELGLKPRGGVTRKALEQLTPAFERAIGMAGADSPDPSGA